MNNQFKKGIENIQNISLASTEKEIMLSKLLAYAQEESLRDQMLADKWTVSIYQRFFSYSRLTAVTLALLLIFISTGTLYASETALPGDILYPVKIHATESLRGALAVTVEQKAQWEIQKISRRLEEAQAIVLLEREEGHMSLTKDIENNIAQFNALTKQLDKEGKREQSIELRSDLEAHISAHAVLIGEMTHEKKNNSSDPGNNLDLFIQDKAHSIEKEREQSEKEYTAVPTKEVITKKIKDLEKDLNQTEKDISGIVEDSGDTLQQTRQKLKDTREELKKIKEKSDEPQYESVLRSQRAVTEADIILKQKTKTRLKK